MRTLCVIQHIEAEFLGLMEDHLESRNIRFRYVRPFTEGTRIPASPEDFAGLVLLGAGPYGVVSGHILPSLGAELRLARAFLNAELPVIGVELGAVILAVAAGGGAEEAPLRLWVDRAARTDAEALGGWLPERFPFAAYLRDRPVPGAGLAVLARDQAGEPVVFAAGERAFGFLGHPGMKRGMAEDVAMAFEETPENLAAGLEALAEVQAEIAHVLSPMMVGLIQRCGLMD
ncbi:MAG: hypothetical protein IRZ23_03455 [Acetobacteraceae bacterium]|nr:hypothetical protein [Acetobacteraceae bacterium]